jgi:hypothetical protein
MKMYKQKQFNVILIQKKYDISLKSDDNILMTAVLNFTVTFVFIC